MTISLKPAVKSYPDGYYYMDTVITPFLAANIAYTIPSDSYHWEDMERKRPGKLEEYSRLLIEGKWKPNLISNGLDNGHPIRFNQDNELTHGFIRVLAVIDSGVPMPAIVVFPPNGPWATMFLKEDGENT